MGRRKLLERFRGKSWVLKPKEEILGLGETDDLSNLIDEKTLCGLEVIRDAAKVALQKWGCSLANLRVTASHRVRDESHP